MGTSAAAAADASTGSTRLRSASGPDDDVHADVGRPDATVHAGHATKDAGPAAAASCTSTFQRVFSEPIGRAVFPSS